jgi:hypothetical protein
MTAPLNSARATRSREYAVLTGMPIVRAMSCIALAALEDVARSQISEFIMRRFAGHDMTRLVEAVLTADGYLTERADPGADGGVDILAGRGELGFGSRRLRGKDHGDDVLPLVVFLVRDARFDQALVEGQFLDRAHQHLRAQRRPVPVSCSIPAAPALHFADVSSPRPGTRRSSPDCVALA